VTKQTASGQKAIKSKAKRQLAGAPKGYEVRPAFMDSRTPT